MSTRLIKLQFVRLILLGIVCLAPPAPLRAEEARLSREQALALVSGLKYQEGEIPLHAGLATLRVPAGFRFLDGADSSTVLVKLWGNPPQPNPLGEWVGNPLSLAPDSPSPRPFASGSAFRAPHYDRASHKLYWAKALQFGQSPEETLNYNIRMLGRSGVLVLNAVAGMAQLPEIERATPKILQAIDFNPGHRYGDFNPKSDKVATYGLAALVAGGVAAKLGLFKGLWVAALAAKKFIIIGVVAVAAWLRKLFKGKEPAA